jgi:hypothetical protein
MLRVTTDLDIDSITVAHRRLLPVRNGAREKRPSCARSVDNSKGANRPFPIHLQICSQLNRQDRLLQSAIVAVAVTFTWVITVTVIITIIIKMLKQSTMIHCHRHQLWASNGSAVDFNI